MTPLLGHLSPREEEVLDLIADGFGVREIAGRLGIRPSTVESYRDEAKRKLGATSTPNAVKILVLARSGDPA